MNELLNPLVTCTEFRAARKPHTFGDHIFGGAGVTSEKHRAIRPLGTRLLSTIATPLNSSPQLCTCQKV